MGEGVGACEVALDDDNGLSVGDTNRKGKRERNRNPKNVVDVGDT